MQIEELKQNRFVRNFVRDRWLILGSAGLVLLFALIYVGFIYKPKYTSEAKVWIKDTSTASYLSDVGDGGGYLRPLTTGSNPVMAQVQILNSNEMADFLAAYVEQREAEKNGGRIPDKYKGDKKPNTNKIMKIKTEPNNDIIDVKLSWTDPVLARDMLGAALKKFDETNLQINREIYTKKRAYLDKQLTDIETRLVAVRNRIKDFQAGNMAVDVDAQTQELVRLRSQLVAQLESVMAARNNNASYASSLQGQLGMSPKTALTAVALGSGNENLVKLRSDLAVLKQQYAHDSVKQAPTNPQLVALKNQITALESQIGDEVRQTVGRSGSANGPRVYDSVRSQLVQDLSSARSRSTGLGSEAASLRSAIARVDSALKTIPQSKFTLSNMQEEEKTLAAAFDELRKKQIDASIKEAETPSNLFVVDQPTMPENASFPAPIHVLALSMLLGLMAGLGLSTLKTYSEDLAEGPEMISEATRSKILGIIPWLARPVAQAEENVLSINDVAYKHLVSNLRLEAGKNDAEVIAFTSSSLQKPQVSTAYFLAQRLSRLGHSVALIDADFRPSNLVRFVTDTGMGVDLSDLILDTDLKLRKGQAVYPEEIMTGLRMDGNGVYLALNRQELDHAYDYFASRGFRHIVNMLKEQFDWVFIDTPSATIAPEFTAITEISDGVVLFADRKATFSTLRQISRKIRETQKPLLGTVIREKNTQLEREHEQYANWRGHWKGGSGGGGIATANTVAINSKRIEFMGAKIDALTMQETIERVTQIIQNREKVQHVVVNVAKLMTMQRDSQLKEIVNSSGLINADGAGVVLGAKLLGYELPERVAGIDLMQELVKTANQKAWRIFFLGAEEDVVRDVVTTYKRRFPSLQICGYRNGYFQAADELEVAMQIREARPDILFVGMSSPKKEKFIRKYMDEMNVPFVMGVGGSFDVVAGKVSRAPQWMQAVGMEWFYRLVQEPGRMWKRYLVTNTQFGWALAAQLISGRNGEPAGMRPANG